jgi:hypothetical protein
MKSLRLLALMALAFLVLPVAACSTLLQTASEVGTAVSTVKTIYEVVKDYYTKAPVAAFDLHAGFVAVQSGAAQFKKTQCPSVSSHSWCLAYVKAIRQWNGTIENDLVSFEAYITAHPTLDATSLFHNVVTDIESFAKVAAQYGVPAPTQPIPTSPITGG